MATRKRKPSGAQHRPNHATRSTKPELKTLAFPRRRSAPIGVRRYWDGILKLEDMPAHLLDTVKRNADTPLLRLPTEIRNRIWNFACGGQLVKLPSKWRTSEKGGAVRYDGDRSLLATGDLNTICNQRPGPTRVLSAFHLPEVCRQIYSETALISYGENVFDLTFIDLHSGSSMSRLMSAQRRAITTLKPDPRYLCSLPQDAGVWSHFKPIRKFLPNVRLLIVTPLAMKAVQLYHIQFTDRTGMAGSWTQEEWRTWLQQELGRWVDESVKMVFEH